MGLENVALLKLRLTMQFFFWAVDLLSTSDRLLLKDCRSGFLYGGQKRYVMKKICFMRNVNFASIQKNYPSWKYYNVFYSLSIIISNLDFCGITRCLFRSWSCELRCIYLKATSVPNTVIIWMSAEGAHLIFYLSERALI